MLLLFKTLQGHGAEFGYRAAYETARFIHFYKLLGNHPDGDTTCFPGAFDCVVFMKLLPRLHDSRAKLRPVLKKLWFLRVNDAASRGEDAPKAAEEAARSTDKKTESSVVVPAGAPYPLRAEEIGRMWRLLIENGFTSFAEQPVGLRISGWNSKRHQDYGFFGAGLSRAALFSQNDTTTASDLSCPVGMGGPWPTTPADTSPHSQKSGRAPPFQAAWAIRPRIPRPWSRRML